MPSDADIGISEISRDALGAGQFVNQGATLGRDLNGMRQNLPLVN